MEVSNRRLKHVDVVIVGAGISGVDVAYRLQERCPDKSFLLLEARGRVGGTWDLFRYPGVRSDSDMFTLGFPFRPWRSDRAIVEGPEIREYVEDTAREFGIFDKIRFGCRVKRASWASGEGRWTVHTEEGACTCSFLYLASGYYDYEEGFRPEWPGEDEYRGRIIHPQFWPEGLDLADKRVAVIGSGATAVTLVPALSKRALHVALVQRTPSYIVARPAHDSVAGWLQRKLPRRVADRAVRWKNILLTIFMYRRARSNPERVSNWIRNQVQQQLPPGYPVERDFTPPYKPWDQRLCLVPDGDLFAAMRGGRVSVATGSIDRFTPKGLLLSTGEQVEADIVVTATGLNVRLLGGIQIEVDGQKIEPADLLIWKGMMLSGVPNLAFSFGYINASWTLRSDLSARTFCRLLKYMARRGLSVCTPVLSGTVERKPVIDFSSGYVQRALATTPSQGDRRPWHVHQNYVRDAMSMMLRPIDEALQFRKASS